jgi:hypothetical protein
MKPITYRTRVQFYGSLDSTAISNVKRTKHNHIIDYIKTEAIDDAKYKNESIYKLSEAQGLFSSFHSVNRGKVYLMYSYACQKALRTPIDFEGFVDIFGINQKDRRSYLSYFNEINNASVNEDLDLIINSNFSGNEYHLGEIITAIKEKILILRSSFYHENEITKIATQCFIDNKSKIISQIDTEESEDLRYKLIVIADMQKKFQDIAITKATSFIKDAILATLKSRLATNSFEEILVFLSQDNYQMFELYPELLEQYFQSLLWFLREEYSHNITVNKIEELLLYIDKISKFLKQDYDIENQIIAVLTSKFSKLGIDDLWHKLKFPAKICKARPQLYELYQQEFMSRVQHLENLKKAQNGYRTLLTILAELNKAYHVYKNQNSIKSAVLEGLSLLIKSFSINNIYEMIREQDLKIDGTFKISSLRVNAILFREHPDLEKKIIAWCQESLQSKIDSVATLSSYLVEYSLNKWLANDGEHYTYLTESHSIKLANSQVRYTIFLEDPIEQELVNPQNNIVISVDKVEDNRIICTIYNDAKYTKDNQESYRDSLLYSVYHHYEAVQGSVEFIRNLYENPNGYRIPPVKNPKRLAKWDHLIKTNSFRNGYKLKAGDLIVGSGCHTFFKQIFEGDFTIIKAESRPINI